MKICFQGFYEVFQKVIILAGYIFSGWSKCFNEVILE